MTQIAINRLTNANVYIGANSLLGKLDEIELPEVKIKTAEHKALGMIGAMKVPAGIEIMEGKFKWNSLYPDVLKRIANPFRNLEIQVRGSLEQYTIQGRTLEIPVKVLLTIAPLGLPGGSYKQNENVEAETEFTAFYMKQVIGGEDIVEVDVLNNIYKAGGEDLLQQYRSNIGG